MKLWLRYLGRAYTTSDKSSEVLTCFQDLNVKIYNEHSFLESGVLQFVMEKSPDPLEPPGGILMRMPPAITGFYCPPKWFNLEWIQINITEPAPPHMLSFFGRTFHTTK